MNTLLKPIKYKTTLTSLGQWQRFGYPSGGMFEEFTSHWNICGLPLLHYTRGRNPETGRRKVATGVVAVGQVAIGLLAIGQLAVGLVAIGQAAFGLFGGLGQLSCGIISVGQIAIGLLFAAGQIAVGCVAIGQAAFGLFGWGMSSHTLYGLDALPPLLGW